MSMPSIPASQIVQVTPGVIGAGGSGLTLNGLFLTTSIRPPIGEVVSLPTPTAVEEYFGPGAPELTAANIYFGGFDNSNVKPGAMLFAQYPLSGPVAPYIRGGASTSLAAIQALTPGTMTIAINGQSHTSSSINLSGATSFSNAASTIQSALGAYDAVFTGSITGTALTVGGSVVGALEPGQLVTGAGVTAGTTIVSGSGTSWVVSASQTVSSETLSCGPAEVTYDSVAEAFVITGGTPGAIGTIAFPTTAGISTGLGLTAATGAVLSQGAPEATPVAFMTALAAGFQNWAKFSTIFEPVTNDKVSFAQWTNSTGNRFAYVMSDSNAAPTTGEDTSSAGYLIQQAGYSGTIPIYDPQYSFKNAFNMGATAAIDFTQEAGRITFAFKSLSGLLPDVTSETIADNLIADGYNFYGAYATAAQGFVFYYPGSITGPFEWDDSYCNQIALNAAMQLALMELLTQVKSIPYNNQGAGLIASALNDPISAAVNFGSVVAGVTLSSAQQSEVNTAAGLNIVPTLFQQGWYLQIGIASAQVRGQRGSPPITLWYCDGEAVQKIAMASIDIL